MGHRSIRGQESAHEHVHDVDDGQCSKVLHNLSGDLHTRNYHAIFSMQSTQVISHNGNSMWTLMFLIMILRGPFTAMMSGFNGKMPHTTPGTHVESQLLIS